MKKGAWRIVESVLAMSILMGFLLSFPGTKFVGEENKNQILQVSYEKLEELYFSGDLHSFASLNDWSGLKSKLSIPGYNHTVEICDDSGCYGEKPNGTTVWVSTYVVSGKGSYKPSEIKLYVWR